MTDDKIEAWLKEAEHKASAMKHWTAIAIENGSLPPEHWNDGPYPIIEKLLALVRVYREANKIHMSEYHDDTCNCLNCDDGDSSREAEEKAKGIIDGQD